MELWPSQAVDTFGNLPYEDVCIVHKSKLELEKEAGESKAHKSVTPGPPSKREASLDEVRGFRLYAPRVSGFGDSGQVFRVLAC